MLFGFVTRCGQPNMTWSLVHSDSEILRKNHAPHLWRGTLRTIDLPVSRIYFLRARLLYVHKDVNNHLSWMGSLVTFLFIFLSPLFAFPLHLISRWTCGVWGGKSPHQGDTWLLIENGINFWEHKALPLARTSALHARTQRIRHRMAIIMPMPINERSRTRTY